jgi:hypothetical protein
LKNKYTNTLKYIKLIIYTILCLACSPKKYEISTYYTQNEQDSLLVNMVTLIYKKAPGATDSTRFNAEYKDFYKKNTANFKIISYFIAPNNWHYYFITRPVGGSSKRRGVVGKFKLAENNLRPIQFEETINTPHLDEKLVVERGSFLFQEFIKADNLDKYLPMKQYIEWPDSSLIYNKKTNNWEAPISKISTE